MDPTFLFIISIAITIILFAFLIYFVANQFKALRDIQSDNEKDEILTKWLENMQGTVDTRLQNVQKELHNTTDTLNKRVDASSKGMNTRLDKAAEVISAVQKELGSMSEIGRGMKDLQDFLRSPKLRGNIGEQILKDLLEQMLPNANYSLQYTFKTGDRVDALLYVEEGSIPVDSKFPMENFNAIIKADIQKERDVAKANFINDVRKHIRDISSKYILPQEGTVDFALMYIPSEAIYYEVVVNNPELGKYSWEKRVLPVSPNVFYSYLKAILIGLEGKKVESRAREILSAIRSIKEDAGKFSESLRVMTKHISNAKNSAEDVNRNFEHLENRIGTLDGIKRLDAKKEAK